MALVNPNIAMSFRQPEIQAPNALAQYAQIQQIMGGQQAQELNKLQIQEYQRTRDEEAGTRNFLRGRDLSAPDTRSGLAQFGKTGLAYAKLLQEQDTAALNAKNTQSQIDERDLGLRKKKLDFAYNAIGSAPTPDAAIAEVTKGIKDGVFDMKSATAEIRQLQNMTPEQYQQYRVQKVMGILEAKDKLGFMLPKITRQDAGGQIVPIQDNPALPGYGLPVQGMAPITKTATIGERTAQSQLSLAERKFAWEQANPGFELKESEDGTMYGVNKRTLQAKPVMVGGTAPTAAPAAAPGASIMRQPAATPATQAIPGMTSVLDKPAAAAPAAGVPSVASTAGTQLRGKGQGLTEGERKASTLLQRLQFSQGQLTQALVDDPNAAKPGLFTSALDMLSTPVANTLTSEARQRVASAQLDILDAALTLGTGAAYTKDQLEGYRKSYFPQIGDGPQQVKDKKARLENVISAAKIAAGRGAALVPDTLSGANPNDPMDLGIRGR
jgi:hypothetical protein